MAFSTQPSFGVISISSMISGLFEIAFLATRDSFESRPYTWFRHAPRLRHFTTSQLRFVIIVILMFSHIRSINDVTYATSPRPYAHNFVDIFCAIRFSTLFSGFWSLFLEVLREHFKREHHFLALLADSHFWKLANHRHFRWWFVFASVLF